MGTYIYFLNQSDYIFLMHDLVIDVSNDTGDANYFPIWYKDDTTFEVWINGSGTATLERGPINHIYGDVSSVNETDNPIYDFAACAGFADSPHSPQDHRMYEFRLKKAGFRFLKTEDITIGGEWVGWKVFIPEFPLGAEAAAGIGLMVVVVYIWRRRRKTKPIAAKRFITSPS